MEKSLTTVEGLRAELIADIDGILGSPWIVRKFLSADHIRVLNAQRNFWQQDTGAALQRLLDLVQKEP